MRQLARFAITARDEDFVIRLKDATGEEMAFAATPDQLDDVVEALDEVLRESEGDVLAIQNSGQGFYRPVS